MHGRPRGDALNRSTVINSKTDFCAHEHKMRLANEFRAKSPDVNFIKNTESCNDSRRDALAHRESKSVQQQYNETTSFVSKNRRNILKANAGPIVYSQQKHNTATRGHQRDLSDVNDGSAPEHSGQRPTTSGLKVKNVRRKNFQTAQNNFVGANAQYVRAIVNSSVNGRPTDRTSQGGIDNSLDRLAASNVASDQVIIADVKNQPHFNNKIIINQQHYFTDSIKIYQNQSQPGQPPMPRSQNQNQAQSPNSHPDEQQIQFAPSQFRVAQSALGKYAGPASSIPFSHRNKKGNSVSQSNRGGIRDASTVADAADVLKQGNSSKLSHGQRTAEVDKQILGDGFKANEPLISRKKSGRGVKVLNSSMGTHSDIGQPASAVRGRHGPVAALDNPMMKLTQPQQMLKDISIKQQRFDYNKYLKGSEVPHAAVSTAGVISSQMMGNRSVMDYI